MDSATDGGGAAEAEDRPPRECMACRGTGKVTSHLGGEASTVTCPWCDGSGVRGAISDAQARWKPSGEGPADA
jgi:DnaJ-class molecular chaperone